MNRKEWAVIWSLFHQVEQGQMVRADRRMPDGTRVILYRQGPGVVNIMIRRDGGNQDVVETENVRAEG